MPCLKTPAYLTKSSRPCLMDMNFISFVLSSPFVWTIGHWLPVFQVGHGTFCQSTCTYILAGWIERKSATGRVRALRWGFDVRYLVFKHRVENIEDISHHNLDMDMKFAVLVHVLYIPWSTSRGMYYVSRAMTCALWGECSKANIPSNRRTVCSKYSIHSKYVQIQLLCPAWGFLAFSIWLAHHAVKNS